MNINLSWYRKHVFSISMVNMIKFPDLRICPQITSTGDVEVFLLSKGDIPSLMDLHDTKCIAWNHAFTAQEAEERLASGQICSCARVGGRMAGFVWFAPRSIYSPDLRCTFELDSTSVVIHNGFVDPAYRGMKVGPQMIGISFRRLAETGYKTVYGYPRVTNRASKKAMGHHGFVTFGSIVYGYVLGYYYFLPFLNKEQGIHLRLEVSPWHRWRTFARKRGLVA